MATPTSEKERLPGLSLSNDGLKPHGLVGKKFGNHDYQKKKKLKQIAETTVI